MRARFEQLLEQERAPAHDAFARAEAVEDRDHAVMLRADANRSPRDNVPALRSTKTI